MLPFFHLTFNRSTKFIATALAFAAIVLSVQPAGALISQDALNVTSVSGVFATPLTLTTSGGSGTGAVTYSVTNDSATGCSISGATLTSSSAGTCLVTATKAGDATFDSATSVATDVTLAPATSTPVLTSSLTSPQDNGISMVLTETIPELGASDATGTVNFELAGVSITGCATQTLVAGVATCTTTALTAGTNTFSALYAGDTNYVATTSTLTFVGEDTPNPPTGVSATLATGSSGSVVVSWTEVTTGYDLTVLGYTVTANIGGLTCTVAAPATSCTVPGLTIGTAVTFSVTATSSGGTSPSSASSAPLTPTLASTTTTLGATPNATQNVGTAVTITATVTPGASGTVDFYLGGVSISTCGSQSVSAGVASCTTTALVSGPNAITATYLGDANFAPSTSTTFTYTMTSTPLLAPTSVLSVNSTSMPDNVTLTLTTLGGSGTGAVTFFATNGTATGCGVSGATLLFTSAGTCLVTATQASDATYVGQSSTVTTVTVFSAYAATYGAVSSNSGYGCPSGGSLSGATCTISYAATYAAVSSNSGYSCPSGGSLAGTVCITSSYSATYGVVSSAAVYGYYCGSGWTWTGGVQCYRIAYVTKATCLANGGGWNGSACVLYIPASYGILSYTYTYGYYCPSGGSLSGTTCIVSSYGATYGIISYNYAYVCSSGDTLSGTTCTHTYSASYGIVSYNYGYACPYGGSLSATTCTLSALYGHALHTLLGPDVVAGRAPVTSVAPIGVVVLPHSRPAVLRLPTNRAFTTQRKGSS